ncbi:MAG: hypothetical protein IKA02_01745, partial [Clostridia bacterium]|nr:hypothetical protein [Clostridia bacterium]
MFNLNYIARMLDSLSKEDNEFSFGDVYNWYEKYNYELTHSKYPINETDIAVDKILQKEVWENVALYFRYYLEDLVDTGFGKLLEEINRLTDILKIDVLARTYTDGEKSLILKEILDNYKPDALTENEKELYKNLALELSEKGVREGLLAVGYGSYGGDGIFECDYNLSEKCMLKLIETVDRLPEKGFYANTLGYIYYYGRTNNGVADYQKAYLYFSFGASCGIYESIYKLSDLYNSGLAGVKSPACAKKLLFDIYGELYSRFLSEEFDCEFADVALRLGKFAMNETVEGFYTYASALNYFTEAQYALSLRNKFGDESVKNRLE